MEHVLFFGGIPLNVSENTGNIVVYVFWLPENLRKIFSNTIEVILFSPEKKI